MSMRFGAPPSPLGNSVESSEITDGTIATADLNAGILQGLTTVTAVATDYVALADTSDSGNAKKALVSDITALAVADTSLVHISGTETVTGAKTFSSAIKIADGAAATPSLAFSTIASTGMYLISDDGTYSTVGWACRGVEKMRLQSSATGIGSFELNRGKGSMDFRFRGQTDDALIHALASTERVGIKTEAPNKTLDVTGDGAFSSHLTIGGETRVADGSVGTPGLNFSSDTDNGIYRFGANQWGLVAAGGKVCDISSSGLGVTGSVTSSTVILSGAGAVGAPAHSFSSDSDSGLYSSGANEVSMALAGSQKAVFTTTGIGLPDGGPTAPFIYPISDPNTGMYSIGADQLGITVGGAVRLSFNTTQVWTGSAVDLGVGASPSYNLDVQKSTATGRVYSTTTNNDSTFIVATAGGTATGYLSFQASGAATASIGVSATGNAVYNIGRAAGKYQDFQLNSTSILYLTDNNVKFNKNPHFNSGNTTGAGSAALGSNCPAVTASAPYTWITALSSDGSTVYIPCWK